MAIHRRDPVAAAAASGPPRSGKQFIPSGWLNASDPGILLEMSPHTTARQLRLFACACCRQVWHLLKDERSRRVVRMAEEFADGRAGWQELEAARLAAWEVEEGLQAGKDENWDMSGWAVARAAAMTASHYEWDAAERAAWDAVAWAIDENSEAWSKERVQQCVLLRDILGNPFQEIRLDPLWLAWNDGCALKMAQAIYDERRFTDLPVLADVLQEAGCQDAELLGHCRAEHAHVRGCWLLDAIRRTEGEDEATP
jgi:hypothetical protein